MSTQKGISWTELIVGLFFLFAGVLCFMNPGSTLRAFVIIFGVTAIVRGIGAFILYAKIKEVTGAKASMTLVSGILNLALGVIFLLKLNEGVIALGYLFAIWFIVDSIASIINSNYAKSLSIPHYWLTLILNLLCLFVGISLLFDPVVSAFSLALLVGIYFFVAGIQYIVLSVSNGN